MKKLSKIAFLIPAYNEEKVISSTIRHLLLISQRKDIYMVDDGSKDRTYQTARRFGVNAIRIKNGGKANAINTGVKEFNLTKSYKYIMPVDADTVLSPNLSKVVIDVFEKDTQAELAAVVCKVVGRDTSLTTTYRMWEYEISQTIHKAAQSIINAITVNPGCSTIYRSEIFEKMDFPHRTMTEDMDMTFYIHRKRIGKIKYIPNVTVITQDPKTIKEYVKQIRRWYTGFWHCVIKHDVPWGGQILDLELIILGLEGVFNGLLSLFLIISVPIVLVTNPKILLIPFLLDLGLYLIPAVLYTSIKLKTLKMIMYSPLFYFLRLLSGVIFLESFIKAVSGIEEKRSFVWDTERYVPREEAIWVNQTS